MPKTSRDFTTYLFEKMVGIHCVRDNGVIANQWLIGSDWLRVGDMGYIYSFRTQLEPTLWSENSVSYPPENVQEVQKYATVRGKNDVHSAAMSCLGFSVPINQDNRKKTREYYLGLNKCMECSGSSLIDDCSGCGWIFLLILLRSWSYGCREWSTWTTWKFIKIELELPEKAT